MRAPGSRSPRELRRWALFFGLATAVVLVDQATKSWIDGAFAVASSRGPQPGLAAPTSVLGEFVRIAKTYNTGGIFGLFGSTAPVLAAMSVLVIALIVFYQARSARTAPLLLTVALGLLLGGAIGNLVDRVRFGHVIDFVDMGVGSFRWYTFNVADASISTAVVALIALSLFGDRWSSSRRATEGAVDRPGEPAAASTRTGATAGEPAGTAPGSASR